MMLARSAPPRPVRRFGRSGSEMLTYCRLFEFVASEKMNSVITENTCFISHCITSLIGAEDFQS
jgi:UDP-N-acetylglucosamine transferase subunit ALG13